MDKPPLRRGRGAAWNPQNRFAAEARVPEPAAMETIATEVIAEQAKEIIAFNDSPDVGFNAGINPYRGCEHGCVYCYARPSHEYLGYSAGLDFETKIIVKENAALRLRATLARPAWIPQVIALSGN